MQLIVKTRFRSFNEPFEGAVPWMYQDIKGLITVGVGNVTVTFEAAYQQRLFFTQRSFTRVGVADGREWRSENRLLESHASLLFSVAQACHWPAIQCQRTKKFRLPSRMNVGGKSLAPGSSPEPQTTIPAG